MLNKTFITVMTWFFMNGVNPDIHYIQGGCDYIEYEYKNERHYLLFDGNICVQDSTIKK